MKRIGLVSTIFVASAAFFAVVMACEALSAEKRLPSDSQQIQLSFAPLVRKVAPAVVNIYTRKVVRSRQFAPLFDDPFFRRFFGGQLNLGRPREQVQNSLGSGVIIRSRGLIITNQHVIEGADQITVVLADRREFEAEVVGTDKRVDLALLRVDTKGEALPFLGLRDSDELEVGDLVIAIGNPFGVGQTVTSGIVSALARTRAGISNFGSFIQTDAAINPGNSGGALVGMDGKLVGINTAIFSKSGGSLGIGFAIPANMVRSVIAGVTNGGRLVRLWLGASGQLVTADLATSLNMSHPAGVLINEIHPRGAAANAGLKVGDVILSINDKEVNDPQALKFRIATLVVGETAKIGIWRQDRKMSFTINLTTPPDVPPRETTELSGSHPLAGATVANMSPAFADELGLDTFDDGVMILQIHRGSSARRLRFQAGDMLLAVNGKAVTSVRRLKELITEQVNRWHITLKRNGKQLTLVINR